LKEQQKDREDEV